MIRVNLVPVSELCDQHLLTEHKELVRIPQALVAGSMTLEHPERPYEYCIGKGHAIFFTNKLRFLFNRYQELDDECVKRGLKATYSWPVNLLNTTTLRYWDDYRPTRSAVFMNRQQLKERMPKNAKHSMYV